MSQKAATFFVIISFFDGTGTWQLMFDAKERSDGQQQNMLEKSPL